MPGRATAEALDQTGHAAVLESARSLTVVDARPGAQYSIEEHDKALAVLSRKAGPATEGVVERVNASFASFRGELNDCAGGQASSRVMLLAHNAQRAQLAVELQTTLSTIGHGQFADGKDGDKKQEQVSKGLRNLVGLCAFAADLCNKAHAAALEEGRAKQTKGTATDRLLTAIGVEAPTPSPLVPPGGLSKGPLASSIPNPPKESE